VGIAVTRRTLDSALVQDAIDAGVVFRDGVRAQLLAARTPQGRLVRLTGDAGATTTVRARVVVAADGLGSPSLARDRAFGTRSAPGSRVGLGLRLESPSSLCERGSALMAIGRRGYVGMVICESGVLNAAAAVDPAALRGRSSAGEVVASILCEAGVPNPFEGASSPWSTVPRLTQSATTVAADRVFLVGDAAGYVEPFTGEGMANAAEDALRVAPLAAEAATEWSDALGERWRAYDRHVRAARSRDCRRLAWLLRHPALVSVAMRTAALAPSLAARLTRRVSAPRATFAGRLP
jgi:flavin-dependent dehydrogenase